MSYPHNPNKKQRKLVKAIARLRGRQEDFDKNLKGKPGFIRPGSMKK